MLSRQKISRNTIPSIGSGRDRRGGGVCYSAAAPKGTQMTTAVATFSADPIVEFSGVVKRFGGITALDNVSFGVPRGEIHALVGENGAGKTTLICVCGGLFQPDAGAIRFDGAEVR